MSRRSAFVVAAGATAATFMFAPGAQAAGASATAGLTYVVHGTTVNFTPTLDGTQHSAMNGSDVVVQPGPMSYALDFGDGTDTGGDAGAVDCTNTGLSPLHFSAPTTHHYTKPGTYTVKLRFIYCGESSNSLKSATYHVVVGQKGTAKPVQPLPTEHKVPVHKGGAKPLPVGPARPVNKGGAPRALAPKAPAATVGPKVQTDQVSNSNSSDEITLAIGLSGTVLAGAAMTRKVRRD